MFKYRNILRGTTKIEVILKELKVSFLWQSFDLFQENLQSYNVLASKEKPARRIYNFSTIYRREWNFFAIYFARDWNSELTKSKWKSYPRMFAVFFFFQFCEILSAKNSPSWGARKGNETGKKTTSIIRENPYVRIIKNEKVSCFVARQQRDDKRCARTKSVQYDRDRG